MALDYATDCKLFYTPIYRYAPFSNFCICLIIFKKNEEIIMFLLLLIQEPGIMNGMYGTLISDWSNILSEMVTISLRASVKPRIFLIYENRFQL